MIALLPDVPSEDPKFLPKTVATHLATLASSSLGTFVSTGTKGAVDSCCEHITNLANRRPPKFVQGKMAHLVKAFVDKCAHLVVWHSIAHKDQVHRGKDALATQHTEVSKSWNKGGQAKDELCAKSVDIFRFLVVV